MKIRKVEIMPATKCDYCEKEHLTIIIDAPTSLGPWANMCESCYYKHGKEPATKFVLTKRPDKEYSKEDELNYANKLTQEELESIMFDGDCEAVDGCVVEPDGMCSHGYKSPLLILGVI